MSNIGFVTSSSSENITVEVEGLEILEKHKIELQVGKFLKIEDGNHNFAVASIKNIAGKQIIGTDSGTLTWQFLIECTPVGALINEGGKLNFVRGIQVLPVPTEKAHIFDAENLSLIFSKTSSFNFQIGTLASNSTVPFYIDGDKFFGKHIGVVGSTGSGKSCTVASLIQSVVGISECKNLHLNEQKNAHILIFDIHSEYSAAFKIHEDEKFNLNLLDVDKLRLPYWLMNSEELESLFIESNEQNSHNQISQFKRAVILNKERHNSGLKNITYDTPIYFSIKEVFNYISNMNDLTVYEKEGKTYFASLDDNVEYSENLLWDRISFEASTGNGIHKVLGAKVSKEGGFHGEFDRFVSRLETKLNDKRLAFLLNPLKKDGSIFGSEDFELILKQFLGYIDKANISIVDLSGIPFEVLSLSVSLISRLIFDFAFHYSKLKHATNETNDIPFMIVCEEAHNYIPQSNSADFKASKKSIERIAKEGRKYGLSLMVVSQRPSEVSDTIYSQCNNFVSLRLTNKADQNYIKGLLPDSTSNLLDFLPILAQGEAFVVGDSVLMPSLVVLPRAKPEPKSASIKSYTEWNSSWKNISFDEVIQRWRKE